MKQKYLYFVTVTMFLAILSLGLVQCATPLADEQFTLDGTGYIYDYTDFRFALSAGDRVAINISVTGDPLSLFGLYNSTETYDATLLEKRDTSSVTEEWVAPYNDTFDFYFKVNSGIANIHFTLAKLTSADQSGTKGGYDPLTIGIIVAVVIAGVLAIVLIALRIRKKLGLPPPPPPPPPPGSAR